MKFQVHKFFTSISFSSLFIKVGNGDIILLLFYVDDIILTGSNFAKDQCAISSLAKIFNLKDMGQLTYFLGLQIQYDKDGSLFINQSKYVKELLKKARMESCKPTSTASKPHTQLLVNEVTPIADPTHYRSILGAIPCLTFTRPDIAHSVNIVC